MRPGLFGVVASGVLALGLLGASAIILAAGPGTGPVPSPVAAAPTLGRTLAPTPTSVPTATPVPAPATAVPVAVAPDGATVFQRKGCIGCHSLAAANLKANMNGAPELSALAQIAPTRRPGMSAEAYVRESVRQPQAFRVPGFSNDFDMPTLPVSDAELDALVAFLLTRH